MQHTNNATLINLTPTPSSKAKIKIKLTDTLIAKIKPPKRVARGTKKVKLPRDRYYDIDVPALHLRVTHKGTKTWKVGYRNEYNQWKDYTIGTWPRVKTEAARRVAREKNAKVTLGEDVQYKKQQLKDSQSMEVFTERYLTERCKHLSTYDFYKSLFDGHINPFFKKTKVSTITKALVEDFHVSRSNEPFLANRCKAVLHKLFKYAIDKKLMDHNPAAGIKNYPEPRREGYFHGKNLEMLKDSLDIHYKSFPLHTNFFRMIMNSGRRPNEIYKMKWSDIDMVKDEKSGKLKATFSLDTKTGRKTFPLSSKFIENLNDCRRYSGNYIYVFSKMAMNNIVKKSESPTDTYWKTYKRHWATILKRMPGCIMPDGKPPVTYHLRHSFGSHYTKANKNIVQTKEAMGHASLKSTMVYMHVLDDDIRDGIEATTAISI